METIAKHTCTILADVLAQYGVRRVVASPGSRNAPVVVALNRHGSFDITVVVDERTAAFVALGMAVGTGSPVALVCTSGSAVLNYAPALAEAYYRRVPLIVVSADRPAAMIDQRDSQTIRQPGALAAVTRVCVDIAEDFSADYINRLVNKAMWHALGAVAGPVHINVQFSAPLTPMADICGLPRGRKIENLALQPSSLSDDAVVRKIFDRIIKANSALVIAGGMSYDESLCESFSSLIASGIVVLAAEAQSNLYSVNGVVLPDTVAAAIEEGGFSPDLLISIGGPVISDRFKSVCRRTGIPTVNVGYDDEPVDTFGNLQACVQAFPQLFFKELAGYAAGTIKQIHQFADYTSQSDLMRRMLANVIDAAPDHTQLFLGNGMAVRYIQGLCNKRISRVEANRGVSGIDGCTSTAAGASLVTDDIVLLVSGDMGATYDMGAFAIGKIRPNFKMVILDNGGGDIFRHVATTRSLPECEHFFVADMRFPLGRLAGCCGFAVYDQSQIRDFFAEKEYPALLILKSSNQQQ